MELAVERDLAKVLKHNHLNIQTLIKKIAQDTGRTSTEITLLAVSKGQSAEKIALLHTLTNQKCFGENYAQELCAKAIELKHLNLEWYFIGQLQSNKIAKLMAVVSCIQTVTTEKHVRLIADYARALSKTPFPIFIAVNPAGEEQKGGISYHEAAILAKYVGEHHPNDIVLKGLMAIPPAHFNDLTYKDKVPDLYLELVQLARGVGEGQLSLGMSSDLSIAIRAGTDCVRIGTAIFGERNP